jgi:hypothetical protein
MNSIDQELILDYLEGRPSVDKKAVNDLLRVSSEARSFLRRASATEVRLRELACRALATDLRPSNKKLPAWIRSITQIAAGVVVGGLAVGAVWAYAEPKMASFDELPLVDGGLESVDAKPSGVPRRTSDPSAVVKGKGRVVPREGDGMLQFLAASNTGDDESSKNMAADLWQVVSLSGSGHRTVKVRAWFNAETSKHSRFHIAAVAGDGDASSAPDLWEQRYSDSVALAFSRSMIFVDDNPSTWEAGELILQVPPQARVLVIGIAAYRLPEEPSNRWFPGQFVDDVSVSLSSEQVLP